MTVIRRRHAFEGQTLSAIHAIRRRGVFLVLDPPERQPLTHSGGVDRLGAADVITAALHNDGDGASTLGKLGDLLQLGKLIDALRGRPHELAPPVEMSHAAEAGVVEHTEPPPGSQPARARGQRTAWNQLDETARIAALRKLAVLIARMLASEPTEEAGNE